MSTTRWLAETARVVARASARAANGFAPDPGQRPSPTHVVTVTDRECHDGILRYDWSCSCGNALGVCDTDTEARQAAKVHEPGVTYSTRAAFPFAIVASNPRKAG